VTRAATAAVRWTLVVIYLCLIFVMSHRPLPAGAGWFGFPYSDKILHFCIYMVLSLFLMRAVTATWGPARATDIRALTAVAVFGSLYGVTDELHQLWAGVGRTASVWDWAADTLGATAGALVGCFLVRASIALRAGRTA